MPTLLLCLLTTCLTADELPVTQDVTTEVTPVPALETTPVASVAANRWLLLSCGMPGDDEHREKMTEACRQIISAAEPVLGVSPERLRFLTGDDVMHSELSSLVKDSDICTSETMELKLKQLATTIPPQDSCWVIAIGHGSLYGDRSQYNVMEKDFDQKQFGEWVRPLACNEQVFWLTFPISGFWIRPLKNDNRVVITATEADLEFTGTEMPYALASVLAGEGEHASLEDIDQDGTISLLDLYLATNLEIDGRFKAIERLQTEHAQLDDNGDGRGSEVQLAYLPPEKKDEPEEEADDEVAEEDAVSEVDEQKVEDQASAEDIAKQQPEPAKPAIQLPAPISNPNLDGFRSRHIILNKPAASVVAQPVKTTE